MEEEKEMTYDEFEELMKKIEQSMKISREKAETIKKFEDPFEDSHEIEERLMQQGKNKTFDELVEELKADKKEFDEMTVAALEKAVVNVDRIKQEAQAEYNNFYLRNKEAELKIQEENRKFAEKGQERDRKIQEVNEKLQKLVKGKNLKEEILNRIQNSVSKQIEEINKEFEGVREENKKAIEEIKKGLTSSQETQKEKLDNANRYEKEIKEYAAELRAEDKIKEALQKAA